MLPNLPNRRRQRIGQDSQVTLPWLEDLKFNSSVRQTLPKPNRKGSSSFAIFYFQGLELLNFGGSIHSKHILKTLDFDVWRLRFGWVNFGQTDWKIPVIFSKYDDLQVRWTSSKEGIPKTTKTSGPYCWWFRNLANQLIWRISHFS